MQIDSSNAGDSNRRSITSLFEANALRRWLLSLSIGLLVLGTIAVEPTLADSHTDGGVGEAFCASSMALTIQNLFTVIQFGGPLVGGVLALGATVAIPTIRRADVKKELKEVRNQGVIWGVIVAPLATTILGFILNNVVAGGTSCGF